MQFFMGSAWYELLQPNEHWSGWAFLCKSAIPNLLYNDFSGSLLVKCVSTENIVLTGATWGCKRIWKGQLGVWNPLCLEFTTPSYSSTPSKVGMLKFRWYAYEKCNISRPLTLHGIFKLPEQLFILHESNDTAAMWCTYKYPVVFLKKKTYCPVMV